MNDTPRSVIPGWDKNSAAAFTGHRAESLPWGFHEADPRCIRLKAALYDSVIRAYGEGKRVFLSGMASGTDIYAAEAVLSAKKVLRDITLVCVFPCPSSDPRAQGIASFADSSILLSSEYCAGCMQLRNRFLVDNSSLIIAVYDHRFEGGTYHTLCLAQDAGLRIELIGF